MPRRGVLGALSALAVAGGWTGGAAWAGSPAKAPRIAVIGAGIIGVSIAYHLAGRGAAVTVYDKGQPGMGCTQGAFAMLIAGHGDGPPSFNALYGLAVRDWHRLDRELAGRLPLQWGGTVNWAAPGAKAERLAGDCRRLASWGVAARALDEADFAGLCPGVTPGPFGGGYFLPEQGAVDVMGAMAVLLDACRQHGVRFVTGEIEALPVDAAGHAAVLTSQGPVSADLIVLAAGADTTRLAQSCQVRVPIDLVSGTLAHTRPMRPGLLARVLNGPQGSIKQNPDGRFVTGLDYAPGADGKDTSAAYGRHLLANAAAMVPELAQAELDFMTLGYVPIPAEGQQPIIGFCRQPANLYVATMMSGVTMAPLVGRLIAGEVVDRVRADVLAPWRPGRFNPRWAFDAYGGAMAPWLACRQA